MHPSPAIEGCGVGERAAAASAALGGEELYQSVLCETFATRKNLDTFLNQTLLEVGNSQTEVEVGGRFSAGNKLPTTRSRHTPRKAHPRAGRLSVVSH